MAMILLAIALVMGGLMRIFPQFATATLNLILGAIMILAGILMLVGR